ncbi:MAG: amidohydrolase family protein [Singulisphaera sp.]
MTKKLAPPGGEHIYVQAESAKALVRQEFLIVGKVEDAAEAVREAIHIGANYIKIIVDDGKRILRVEEMKAIVDEAHRLKFKVAAHADRAEAVKVSVEAGVDSVEHAYEVSDESLKAMRDKGIFLVPTDLTPVALAEIINKTLRS